MTVCCGSSGPRPCVPAGADWEARTVQSASAGLRSSCCPLLPLPPVLGSPPSGHSLSHRGSENMGSLSLFLRPLTRVVDGGRLLARATPLYSGSPPQRRACDQTVQNRSEREEGAAVCCGPAMKQLWDGRLQSLVSLEGRLLLHRASLHPGSKVDALEPRPQNQVPMCRCPVPSERRPLTWPGLEQVRPESRLC